MEQLIHAFGIDIRLIIIQIINFGVLMALLSYFLYKPVLKLLRDREEKITLGIKDAEAAAVAKAAANTEKGAVLAAAHKDAEAIAKRAEVFAVEQAAEIKAAAEAKSTALLAEAAHKAEELKKRAEKESEAEIAKVAVLAAEKILRQSVV